MAPLVPLLLSALTTSAVAADEPVLPAPKPYGLVQAWLTVYDQDESDSADPAGYGDPEDDPGLKLRRARVGLRGKDDRWAYGLVVGTSSGYDALSERTENVGLVDAYGGVHVADPVWVHVGLQKVPVSREQLMSSANIALGDRSVGTEYIAPGRDVGVTVDAKVGDGEARGRLRVGAYNGNGSTLGDTDDGKLIAGRLEGVVGTGRAYKTWGDHEGITIGVAGDFFMDSDRATSTMGYGGDVLARISGLSVLVEGRFATLKPTDTTAGVPAVLSETSRMGLTGQVGYTLGDWEPVLRYSTYDDNAAIDDNGDVSEGMGGVVWHGQDDVVRAGAGYVLRMEGGGRVLSNDTARVWFQLKI